MSIISKETFDKFTEEEKKNIRKEYKELCNMESQFDVALDTEVYINLFGKENLQPEHTTPKVWSDMETLYEEVDTTFVELEESLCNIDCETKLSNKILATYQIQKLIELGYGGVVTEEEWKEDGSNEGFYCIWANAQGEIECTLVYDSLEFIAFHSQQQAEDFMSYPENVELVKQYYMI